MKTTILTFLAAFLLVVSGPILAQSEEPAVEPEAQETPETTTEEASEPAAVTEEEQAEAQSDEATEEYPADETDADLDETLPDTAGPLALFALLGLTAAGSALGLRSVRRRR
jgi:hypothetical protein